MTLCEVFHMVINTTKAYYSALLTVDPLYGFTY